jgi:uncharacterized protein (DUF4415 family)
MGSNGDTVTHTAEEVATMVERGDDLTDWARVDAMTEEELEASIDREEEGEIDWSTIQAGIPGPKRQITVHLDRDLIDWFKGQGRGYQTRVNAALRGYVEA